tara:strand:- start:20 stop:628 length:609 start_codon:yes stop_codon:yes gene_type:complete
MIIKKNNMINYDDYDFKKNININNVAFKLTNIRLLEKPSLILYNNKHYTILKIICTQKIKIFLKKIEKSLDNNILINFDTNKNLDYYELIINKKIEKLVNSLDNFNYYDIGISLYSNNISTLLLWKLYSIELNNNNNSDELEYEPDYYEIKKDILNKLVKKKYSLTNDLNNINIELIRLENLYNEIKNKFIINKIDNYYNTI